MVVQKFTIEQKIICGYFGGAWAWMCELSNPFLRTTSTGSCHSMLLSQDDSWLFLFIGWEPSIPLGQGTFSYFLHSSSICNRCQFHFAEARLSGLLLCVLFSFEPSLQNFPFVQAMCVYISPVCAKWCSAWVLLVRPGPKSSSTVIRAKHVQLARRIPRARRHWIVETAKIADAGFKRMACAVFGQPAYVAKDWSTYCHLIYVCDFSSLPLVVWFLVQYSQR